MPASPCCARDGLVVLPPRRSTRVLRPVPPLVPDRQVRPLRTPVPKKVSSGTPAATSALRPARSTLSVPRRASRWPCPAPRKTAPQVLGSAASAPFVVNNGRLGQNQTSPMFSHRRCLLDDRRYALRPALLETFCESLAGTCCRAANPGRQNTGPLQGEKRICAAGQGCQDLFNGTKVPQTITRVANAYFRGQSRRQSPRRPAPHSSTLGRSLHRFLRSQRH